MRQAGNVKQIELARVFGRSDSWICKQQKRADDPMPRDLAGATDWGRRHGCLPDGSASQASASSAAPLLDQSGVAHEDARLKAARRRKLEFEISRMSESLVPIAQVEEREVAMAAEFRHAAVEFPLRVRAILERLIDDPARVLRICDEMKPLAAELLNRADPQHLLTTMPKDDVRAMLLRRVDELTGVKA